MTKRDLRKISRQASAGFTLVELLLVITILGILAAMVVPQFTGQGETARIATTRSSISGIATAINTSTRVKPEFLFFSLSSLIPFPFRLLTTSKYRIC